MTRHPSEALSKESRRSLWEDQGRMCHYCDKPIPPPGTKAGRSTHLDHKVAHIKGGDMQLTNLILCCRACNMSKGKKSYEEFIAYMLAVTKKKIIRLSKLQARINNG